MEAGLIILETDMSGCRMLVLISDLIQQMGIGFIRMRVGPGLQTIVGDGLLSTMADGFMREVMVGWGGLGMNGPLPG